MEAFTVSGKWWFPDDPSTHFEGKLEYVPSQGANLTPSSLFSYLDIYTARYGSKNADGVVSKIAKPNSASLLVGVAEGKEYSLLHCDVNAYGIWVGLIAEGIHFTDPDRTPLSQYVLSYTNLDEWAASRRFKGIYQGREDGTQYVQLSYTMPPYGESTKKLTLQNVTVEVTYSLQYPPLIRDRATLKESAEFHFTTSPGASISVTGVVEHYSNVMRNFLMLATWNHVSISYLRAHNTTENRSVEFYWRSRGLELPIPTFEDPLFTLSDLGDNLESVLRMWEGKYHQFRPFIRNYFSFRYLPTIPYEIRFLAYTQALEGYHKKIKPRLKIPYIDKSGKRQNREPRLVERLVDLIKTLHGYGVVSEIVGCQSSSFAQPIVDIRNELTHEADITVSWQFIRKYTDKLELIILLLMFSAVGLPADLVEKIAKENVGFQTRLR